MPDYHDEYHRRVAQFAHFLKLMDDRTHEEAQSMCYLIFDERNDPQKRSNRLIRNRRLRVPQPRYASVGFSSGSQTGCSAQDPAEDKEPWQDRGCRRFVQFCFKSKRFAMDLPNTTIFPMEVQRLIQDRSGFFREAEAPDKGIDLMRYIRKFDPVMKYYMYDDEVAAAEDTAFILFSLCHFPVGSRFFVKASSFRTRHRWETHVPID